MHDRHFRQRICHDNRHQGAEQVGDDHARTGQLNGYAAAEEKADADGATHGDHGELPRAELPVQSFALRIRRIGNDRHVSA